MKEFGTGISFIEPLDLGLGHPEVLLKAEEAI